MNKGKPSVEEFARALEEKAARYRVLLDAHGIYGLREYYEQVAAWNARLHLVAPCSPTEFATRHVLESLMAARFMPQGARVVDVGSGAGLPIIPCLILRADLEATLIEASPKKAVFLREALRRVDAQERTKVLAERFEKIEAPRVDCVTCRALERFGEMFQTLLAWSPAGSRLLLFGGETIREELEKAALNYQAVLIPESERRFLFITEHGRG